MTLQDAQIQELDRKYKEYINNYTMDLYGYKYKITDETLLVLNSHILSMNDEETRCICIDNEGIFLNKKSITYLVRKILALREKINVQYNLNKKYILNNTSNFKITFYVD